MNTRRSIACGTLVVLLVAIAVLIAVARDFSPIPTAAPTPDAATTPDAASYSEHTLRAPLQYTRMESPGIAIPSATGMEDRGVDCIGNGANCEGNLNGTKGKVSVTNNINPPYYWHLKLTCEFGGNKYGPEKPPSADTISSEESCNLDAPAQYWNVIVTRGS